jgi:flagellar biosynthesis protein FliR
MATLPFQALIEALQTFLWPMIRISALMMTAPILSMDAVTLRVRIMISVVLTAVVYPLMDWPSIDPTTAAGLFEVFNQALIGALMGVMLQVVTAALVIGGQAIAASMGLAMANMIDPNMGNVPVIAQFIVILSTLIFVGLGGHLLVTETVLESFRVLPIGQPFAGQQAFGSLLDWSGTMFVGALLVALPVLLTLLLINIGLGVVTRAAPSLNIFAVGFPALILAGFAILIVSMDNVGFRVQWLWLQAFLRLRDVLGLS